MAVVSEMLIRIAADTAQLRSQMQQAEQAVGGSLNGIKNVATQARNALIGFFAIDKATELASTFIKTADAMALTAARLKLVTSSQKEYEAVQKDVYRIAQQNSIGLEEMSQLYTKLHDPVKRLGGTTAETTKITESFALALRVGGANTAEAASATLQFAQAMASGKLSGDEFRSIAEASPRFMKALADGMGVPIEKLKQLGSESKLTADVVGNALMKSLGALQQEAQGLPDTVGGAFTRLKNDVSLFAVELNNATGATGGLADIIGVTAEWVKQITAVFKEWGNATKGTTDQIDLAGIAMRVLGTIFETLIVIGAEVAYVVKGIAKTFADVATLAKAFADGGLDGLSAAYKRVTAENEATLEAHRKFTAGVVGATDRVLQQREALKNNSLSAAENANEMARLTGKHGTLQSSVLKSTAANEEATKAEAKRTAEVKKLMDGLEDQTGALLASEQATGKLTRAEQTALKVMQDLQQGRLKLTDAEKRALVASLELLITTEKRIDADKDLAEAKRKVAEHSAKLTDAEWKEVEALREGNVNLIKQNEVLRIGEAAVRAREAAVLRATARDLEFTAANQGGNAALEEQARLLRQRADLIEEGNVLQYAKDTADEWKRTAENIERSLTDSLMRAFESGKDFGQALKDTLKNLFNTLVLRPIIQPIAQGMSGALLSMLGMPASAAGGGGGGGFSSLISGGMNFLNGNTINAAASGMFTRAGDFLATSSNNMFAGMGNFMQANPAIGSYLGMAGNAVAGYGMGKFANNAISNGYSISSGMGTVQDIATVAASAMFGPIGGAIAGAISGLVNRAFGRKLTDQGIQGTFSGGGFEGESYQFYRGGFFRSDKTKTGDLDADMGAALAAGAGAIFEQVKYYAEVLKLPAEELANVSSYMKISLTDDAEKNQQAISEAMAAYGDALAASFSDVLTPLQREGEKLIETLQRLTILENFSQSINQLGGIFSSIAGSSIEAREALIGMAGGIENLMGLAGSFVQNYYSADEQAGMTAVAIRDALAAAGLTAEDFASAGIDPAQIISRDEFRALVESRDVETEIGREQLMALLSVSDSFAGLSDYMEDSGKTFEELIEAAPQVALLTQMLDPTQVTADNTASMASSLEQSNTTLTAIEGKLDAIATATEAAVSAAAAAVSAAVDAASAASNAASAASLTASRPTFAYDIGGGA